MKKEVIAIILLFLTALLWGSGFPIRKMALESITPLFLNFLRFFIGFILVSIFYVVYNKGKVNPAQSIDGEIRFPIKKQFIGASLMGLMLALGSAFQQVALLTTSSGNTAFLTTLYTIMVPILSVIFLKHKVPVKIWICAAIAVLGIYLIGGGMDSTLKIGDVLAILCALTFAVQMLIAAHFAPKSDAIFLSLCQMLTASLLNLILSLILESGNSFEGVMDAIWPLLYAAVMALAIPYTFQIIGQKYTRSSISAIVLSLESVFGAMFGAIILKETMTMIQLSGCALIFAAIIITQVNIKKKPKC